MAAWFLSTNRTQGAVGWPRRATGFVRGLLAGILGLAAASSLAQTTLYWDVNGATVGAGGATPAGTWKNSGAANDNWSTSSAGTGATAVWTADAIATFSAGTDATGSYTVTVSTTQSVNSIVIQEGTIDFTGGTLSLSGTTPSVDIASGLTTTIDSKISGANGFVKSGAGTLLLTSTGNNYTGATSVNAGTLQVGTSTNILPTATALAIASGATFEILAGSANQTIASLAGAGTLNLHDALLKAGDTTNTTFSGAITDSGGGGTLQKTGTGTLTLSGNSSYTGATTISAGTIVAASSNALGAAASGNTIANGAGLQLTGGVTVNQTDFSIRGTGADGNGVIRNLSGDNTLTSNLTLAAAATITSDANQLTLSGGITLGSRALTIDGAGNVALGGVLSGTGGLDKEGVGTLALSGASTYTGATTINGGTLRLDASNVLSNSTAVTVASGATLNVNGQTETIASLAGAGAVSFGGGSLGTAGNASTTFSGTMSGGGSFTKGGTGILTLTTDLTFNGTFNLAGGTLRLSDMTLTLDTLNLTGNSTIDFAGSVSKLIVTNLNLNGFTLSITNWSNAVDYFYAANWSGATTDLRGAAPMNQVTFNGFTAANTQWQGYDHQVTPVPEPAAYGALLLGALTFLGARRRRA